MPDDPLRLYCPLCDKDYALAAFASHVGFPKHIVAQAWAQRATVEHLTNIEKLLQQLVDKGQQVTPARPDLPHPYCELCALYLLDGQSWAEHVQEPVHKRTLADAHARR